MPLCDCSWRARRIIYKKKKLKNTHYFAYTELSYEELWEIIYDYVNKKYDIDKFSNIFVSGDGASGIKSYTNCFPDAIFVLDKYHYKRKPSYGYHRINYLIRKETGWVVSDNLVHKVCKILNIKSKARHYYIYKKPGEESIKYPNLINNNWNTSRLLEKITSDTTMIWFKKQRYDWTYYVDAFDD